MFSKVNIIIIIQITAEIPNLLLNLSSCASNINGMSQKLIEAMKQLIVKISNSIFFRSVRGIFDDLIVGKYLTIPEAKPKVIRG
jgi:hypothetical protein